MGRISWQEQIGQKQQCRIGRSAYLCADSAHFIELPVCLWPWNFRWEMVDGTNNIQKLFNQETETNEF